MKLLDSIMEWPLVYRMWMAPFAERKFAPITSYNNMGNIRNVLDVGCGPGTNMRHFASSKYLGIDINKKYIKSASRRYGDHFISGDAAEFVGDSIDRFDFILVNSFLHHVDTSTARRILSNLSHLLTEDGHIHILELVLPKTACVERFMAHSDRGKFPRQEHEWGQIFEEAFEKVIFEPYKLGACGVSLWEMVYFKGRARRGISAS